jgi:hypothetical protein
MKRTLDKYVTTSSSILAEPALAEVGDEITWRTPLESFDSSDASSGAKKAGKRSREQALRPDDCQFGDNDLCYQER